MKISLFAWNQNKIRRFRVFRVFRRAKTAENERFSESFFIPYFGGICFHREIPFSRIRSKIHENTNRSN